MTLWKTRFPILRGLALLAPVTPATALPYIELGPSDGLALDQPRVTVELFSDPTGDNSLGPTLNNVFFLDTGANSIMAMKSAVLSKSRSSGSTRFASPPTKVWNWSGPTRRCSC